MKRFDVTSLGKKKEIIVVDLFSKQTDDMLFTL